MGIIGKCSERSNPQNTNPKAQKKMVIAFQGTKITV
jgi:hypothetical protein